MNRSDFEAEFDRMFEEAVRRSELDEIAVPDADSSWQRIRSKLRKERQRVRFLRAAKWSGLAAASLGLGTFLFQSLQPTEAFRPMFEMVYKVKGGSVSLNVASTDQSTAGAKTAPPPPDDELPVQPVKDNRDLPEENAFRREKVTMEEAAARTQFALPEPKYIPDGYTLQEVTIHITIGQPKASAAKLVYVKENVPEQLSILVRKRSYSDHADLPDGKRELTKPAAAVNELELNVGEINVIVKGALEVGVLNRIIDGMNLSE
ncbi:hypothetical protein [Paenibacillus sp. 32352]|uniref:hypothetical protein n=1 Tax=Paenibacillus sp. 32352 TaxID=1969111 RepID=UPI0009AC635C|nr:hypothetical protein [Paenibacillus sp. 32352]